MADASFWKTIGVSLARVAGGILAATVLGILLGMLTARSRVADTLFRPLFTAMKSTPVASVTILLLIWVSRSIVPVLISAVMVFPAIWSGMYTGICELDRKYTEIARVYHITGSKYFTKLLIPGVRPYLEAAFRSAIGFGWKAGIAAEVLTVPGISIGKMIYDSKLYLQTTELFAWTTAVVLLSLALEKLVLGGMGRRKQNDSIQ